MADSGVSGVAVENALPGTSDWKLGALVNGIQYLRSDDESNQIAGYASYTSVLPGGSLDLHISVNASSSDYLIEVFRLGYYQGLGARLIQTISKSDGVRQIRDDHSNLVVDKTSGCVQCGWKVSHTLQISSDWPSGIYLARLTSADRYQCHIVFCVRSAGQASALLYVQPTLTYQAYNGYPFVSSSSFPYPRVGRSLYPVSSISCASTPNPISGGPAAVTVSYDRPYTMCESYVGNVGNGVSFDAYTYEPFFIRWAEQNGYQLDYVTDLDVDALGISLLQQYRGVVFPGHFEYFTKNIRDSLEKAKNQSVHLAFLGANPAYYQVRLESSPNVAGKSVVCYKGATGDPQANTLFGSTLYSSIGRNDCLLAGVSHAICGAGNQILPVQVAGADHWVWDGAGVLNGTLLPGLLGYEVDVQNLRPFSRTGTYTLLSQSSYLGWQSNSSIYQTDGGAWVFAAGTMSWTWGLSESITFDGKPLTFFGNPVPEGTNSAAIQQATANLLNRFLADTSDHSQRSDVAFMLADQSIWVREFNNGAWSEPLALNGATVSRPGISSRTNGDADVFALSELGVLWVKSRRNANWDSWQALTGDNSAIGSPAVSTAPGGGVEVYVLNQVGNYWKRSYMDSAWGAWELIGENFLSSPTVVNCGDINEVFGVGKKGDLQTTTVVNGVSALGWTSLGGKVGVGGCGAATNSFGELLAAVVGMTGALWIRERSPSTGIWGGWINLGGELATTPVVLGTGLGRFDIVVKWRDGSVATISRINGQWTEWVNQGGSISDDPYAVVAGEAIVVHGLGTGAGAPLLSLTIPVAASTPLSHGVWTRVT
ncbi:N,N-dimethylformamidase beta subunit family domain-containing protein [Dyella flava]|uniref:Uncharacterized protein n=1 Tax=Dyella flava TaxID=1920170 RepID=A0ABS2K9M9_9GAMM|nr:N,N-dimethylformamidase beta subunit family domain-containing protein [Dyella flava]MBM7127482.1 hypothetical protein [Dyella flava]